VVKGDDLRARAALWLRALRVRHWAKNLLLFAPLLFGGAFTDPHTVIRCSAGFALVCIVASATYLLNDIIDRHHNSRHPIKRERAIASGAISPRHAALVAAALISLGLAGAALIDLRFLLLLVCYCTGSLVYSLALKKIYFIDVAFLAVLLSYRLFLGESLAGVELSVWLFGFSAFFFLSLSVAKRCSEFRQVSDLPTAAITDRPYTHDDVPKLFSLGIAAGVASLAILFAYLVFAAYPSEIYLQPVWLWGSNGLIAVWLVRVWHLTRKGSLGVDPVLFATRDPLSLLLGAGVLACVLAAMQ
jgi:4-hydroxybenzoate polyprenyltransferase